MKLYGKRDRLPQEVADQLAVLMYAPHSHITVFVISLAVAAPIFWMRSGDAWITAMAVLGVVLNGGRILAVHLFEAYHHPKERSTAYWVTLHILGICFAVTQAALVARAFFLGDTVLISLAVMSAATYVIGLIVRASAVPQMSIPHLMFLFGSLIVIAAFSADNGYLVVALFLGVGCASCVKLSRNLYQRLEAQLLAEYQLSRLACTDYLTGLRNRAGFDDHANDLLLKTNLNGCGSVLALIDLDGFKSVNDTHGHGVGDELLKDVAIRIEDALCEAHFAARLGGDEFAIAFDLGTNLDDAIAIGNRVVISLERPFEVGGIRLQISASVGITVSVNVGDTFSAIMERADKALYQAKNAGRNQAQVLLTATSCKAA
jgi:diguanylate cyclase (GGDEF)-like protein